MKKIAILGSTGSIGAQTLDVVREHSDELQVVALAAGSNKERLKEQIKEFHPKLVSLSDEKKAQELKEELAGEQVEVVCGMEGLIEVAGADSADVVVTAVVGMMGILPTMEAIKKGKDIALANKETLVTAGHLIIPMAKEYGVSILPVDSEHSAIFQSLQGEPKAALDKILLTASGGPFRGKSAEFLETVTLEDALNHPNWSMGPKITIDSSTMVNKGLEVMEAKWLFGVDYSQIEVVIQPQSIIHSMVQYVDGAIIAQLGTPDMRVPIEYALFYPERRSLSGDRLDFSKLSQITFEKPDYKVFRGLSLAIEAGKTGGTMPTVFNAANERAVAKFLKGEIKYTDIVRSIEKCMDAHKVSAHPDLEEILATEQWVYSILQ
ncbi:1-deoxy-D-xylulose-5-phosphate reductoisomerase [Anaerobutyricum hallii]|jgi:1-deoxy-D-xylulose-5-phosphate reductoisomerase|uniref:1-deoxy-D-xylulose 5-phosphate reductoisomerase n=2 Tax=Anaerobutyricum hallii TaxID=39488 RepID=A0A374NNC7_9FIRM|nr:1-deoxy-D-xylulose-5-phosphate reductoisomerase [Anaerobutyricum hallii]RGI87830.1 1-deoxy-D-xylulose-5-phosphate reductoisomerase [Anaerobutyricum hallii]